MNEEQQPKGFDVTVNNDLVVHFRDYEPMKVHYKRIYLKDNILHIKITDDTWYYVPVNSIMFYEISKGE